MTLSTLRTRLETATEADQAEVLEMAFHELIPMPKANSPRPALPRWHDLYTRFCGMREAQAYESAALLIMRKVLPGCGWTLAGPFAPNSFSCASVHVAGQEFEGDADTPALAIIAAVCAAKGDDDA